MLDFCIMMRVTCTGTSTHRKERDMLYIGIDLGTSAVKLLMMDETGAIRKIVSKEYPLYFPHPGWSEQNPEDWYEQSMKGLKELLDGCDRSEVAGISFGGQMHGLVILDDQDQVIRPAILWNDGRTFKETDYLNTVIGKEKLSEYTANIAFAGFTAPKILWVRDNEPENFRKICKIMLPKDYLAYRLTGTFCTDVSDASGMLLLDVKNRKWSKEMMDICSVRAEQLPQLFESYEDHSPVNCVFRVTAVLDDETIYDDTLSLQIDAAGMYELPIENIPVGAKVTVTEVYAGGSYKLNEGSETSQTIILSDDIEENVVTFANGYTGGGINGYGIVNTYTQGFNGWTWTGGDTGGTFGGNDEAPGGDAGGDGDGPGGGSEEGGAGQ